MVNYFLAQPLFKMKQHWPAIGIFCLAFVIRLIYNLTAARNYTPIFDAALYDTIARHLLGHFQCYCLNGSQPAVSRAPLWPWLISVIYFLTGAQNVHVRLFYSLLGSATCVLVYLFASDLFGKRIGLVTGAIAASYTGLFLYDGWLYTESLYTFCVTAFTYALFRLQRASPSLSPAEKNQRLRRWQSIAHYRWAILCGLLIGAASLTRPNGLTLLGILIFWAGIRILAKIKPWQAVIRNTLLISVIAVLLVAPWTYRNYLVAHAFIPVETGAGEVLLGAYNDAVVSGDPGVRGFWRPPSGALNHDLPGYTPENDQQDTQKALAWAGSHLSEMPYLLSLHVINMWTPYTYAHGLPIEEFPDRLSSGVIQALIPLESYPVFVLAAFGLFITWKQRKKDLLAVYLVVAATIAQNIAFYSTMRFRAPIEPLLVLLAGGGIAWLASVDHRSNLLGISRRRFRLARSLHAADDDMRAAHAEQFGQRREDAPEKGDDGRQGNCGDDRREREQQGNRGLAEAKPAGRDERQKANIPAKGGNANRKRQRQQ